MDKSQKAILVIGVLAVLGLLFINIFYALIALVVVLALLMSLRIMGDSADYPDVVAALNEDAKGVTVKNRGTGEAKNIRVAIVPLNIEFALPSLKADEESAYAFSTMIEEAKAVVTYEDDQGRHYSRSYPLSALGGGEEDLLKPAFPIFGWK
ncbi:hypothetical protein FGU65_12825 [Methanoculleus sp. FWC-SCC1]|uniref:DUF58 domain-containing protein n=1 Tax=Methanoculleus frigidifontis TaxID=2584085 RepID=A0ABT8MCS4_9EURY|nr:hypothetical protein [Methanoculleus sp. FWC-SCC1]MDN7025752.1 hypothetical protein [Methanoculleus sp. FWC-SCC1]